MTTPLELGLLVFILTCAVATALLRDVLGSIIAFSAYSLAIAVAWVFLRAPDVGLTEAAVGAGVMTVLFLLTIAKTVRPSSDRTLERAVRFVFYGLAAARIPSPLERRTEEDDPS